MFNKIIKASDGTVLALTEDVTYIKKADNGCYILCPEPDASGISYAGTPYHLLDRDPMGDDLESVMLEQTDIGSWVTETQTAIEDADALNVDQAYRLTLLELGITGAFEGASAIVIPSLCDTLKTVGENWKYAVPSIPFIPMTYPQNRKPAYGVAYTKAGYERVIRDLEKLGGTFSNEKLAASNAVYNRHNAAMRKIDALLAVHPEITAAQRSDIFKSAFFMTKEEHTELVEALIAKLEAQPAAAEKLPIVISGILTDAPALNAIIDEMGMHIVADDVAAQSRQYRTDVPAGDDALQALADKFAAMDNCSVLYNQDKPRVKWIVDTAKERGAKGVLVVLTKFCDPEEFDYVMIKKACEAAGIPLTLVEVDRQMVQFEQVRTNLETFRDLLMM